MTPYADFAYFGVVLYVLVPTLAIGLLGLFRPSVTRYWILLATLGMVLLQYLAPVQALPGQVVPEIYLVAAYALYQFGLAEAFLLFRRHRASRPVFYLALLLGLLPLVLSRLLPLGFPGGGYSLGFLGISYVTFRSLDLLIGIQDKVIIRVYPRQFFAYLLFFPTISSGPIDRYRRFAEDWSGSRDRTRFVQDLGQAIHRVFTGFFYKFIVAAVILRYWLGPASTSNNLSSVASYMYAYSLYLFFDFAGYSSFAIGLSYLLGVRTPENFNRPFLARSIPDFWNRWHMSLSFWFRDHVYTRFVFAATKGRWFRDKYTASYLGFFITMGLMGLWHGTQVYYIAYGLYHGALLVLSDVVQRWRQGRSVWGQGILARVAPVVVTANLVCFGLLIFSGRLSSPYTVFGDALSGDWVDWSWDTTVKVLPDVVPLSGDRYLSVTYNRGWGGVHLHTNGFNTAGYTALQFYLNGGDSSGQLAAVSLQGGVNQRPLRTQQINAYIEHGSVAAGQWRLVRIPLSALDGNNRIITGIIIQDQSGQAQPPMLLDDLQFIQYIGDVNPKI